MCDPDWCLYRYKLKFDPEGDHSDVQEVLVSKHREALGSFLLDGAILYCAKKGPLEVSPIDKCQITAEFLGDMKPRDERYV